MKSIIDLSLSVAMRAHGGKKDIDGEAYILHPLAVGLMGSTDEERSTGFLHDVIENTNFIIEDLEAAGIPHGIVNAVKLLTHHPNTPYLDYIQNIIDSHNPVALKVRYNDLLYHLNKDKAHPEKLEMHTKALEMVKEALKDMYRVYKFDKDSLVGTSHKTAIFAAGCFWGVQQYFKKTPGVIDCKVGYTGGNEENPTYDEVREHHTGHKEAVLVEYDPSVVSYSCLCKLFFEIHDPGQTDGQGPDKGQQYRSAAYYSDKEEYDTIQTLSDILRSKSFVVNTLVLPARDFWVAENYHQDYYENTGGTPYCHFRTKKF